MIANRKRKVTRKGQGATEYIIILVLVAIGSIAVIGIFGEQIRNIFTGATDRLQGEDTAVKKADQTNANKQIDMNEF